MIDSTPRDLEPGTLFKYATRPYTDIVYCTIAHVDEFSQIKCINMKSGGIASLHIANIVHVKRIYSIKPHQEDK